MSRTERSRSPHGELSPALPGSSGPLPRSFNLEKMELVLGGYVVKVYHFSDEPDMPWFQAKPIAVHLDYVQVNHAFGHVDSEDKLTLKELIDKKGCPIGVSPDSGPTGYHDAKAIYVNESGLYSMIFGSKKPEARAFKRWVTHEVLPSIRRKGFYGDVQSAKASVALLTSTVGNLEVALKERDESWKISVHDQCREQLEVARSSFLEAMSTKLTTMTMSLAGHLSSAVKAAVLEGIGLKKAHPKKKTKNAAEMPEEQRATPVQTGPLSLGLSTVALELWSDLPFAVWRKLRGSFGYYAKKERLRCHGLDRTHADHVEKPLLWAYTGATVEGGGARYVYLGKERELLYRVFRAQLVTSAAQRAAGAPRPTESLEQRAHRLAGRLSTAERAAQWPIHAAELEPQWDEMADF